MHNEKHGHRSTRRTDARQYRTAQGAEAMTRARTDMSQIAADIVARVEAFRPVCVPVDAQAWAEIETFIAVALRVMGKTNPSKIRDAAMAEEIKARMDGRGVYEDTP